MVEVSGCPTTCMHCWALGRNYRPMPIEDAAFFLDELSRFCGERGLGYATYPMHEVTAHPDAPDMIRLFAPHLGEAYDPILTPGTPLASRQDWAEIVSAAKQCGARALWVAFHGYGAEHDRQLNRPGAFAETCLAVQRARECGLGTGANVFVTKPGLRDFGRLLGVLLDLQLGHMAFAVAGYTPTPRGRRYEALRPDLATCCRSPSASVMSPAGAARSGAASNRTPRPRGCGGPRRQLARSRNRLLHQRVPSAGLPSEPGPAHRHDRHLPAPPREHAPRRRPGGAGARPR